MTTPQSTQRVSMITLTVKDLPKSRAFYEKIGWTEGEGGNDNIAFYHLNGQYFALYSRDMLTMEMGMPIPERTTGAMSVATNYETTEEADAAFKRATDAGAVVISEPKKAHWGGYSGLYADPDGHLWEVAYNPFWEFAADGSLAQE